MLLVASIHSSNFFNVLRQPGVGQGNAESSPDNETLYCIQVVYDMLNVTCQL